MRIALLLLCAAATIGCQTPGGARQTAQATDEWVHTYSLASGGEVQVINTNGDIEIQSGSAPTVEVRAARVAHATTEAAAQDLLTKISIREESAPERLLIQTERLSGLIIGVSFEVRYQVTVPASSTVRARTGNGAIAVTGPTAGLVVSTANGAVTGKAVSGRIDARAVNGNVEVDVAAVGADPIDLRTTNGEVQISLPKDANANLSATVVNGAVNVTDLAFERFSDQNRRRTRGRINAGGAPIELTTTNGDIHVRERR